MDIKNIEAYAGKVFTFCIRRLGNIDDAQDLSQEILFEIVKGMQRSEIINPDAWVWKVAHNRYAHFLSAKNHQLVSLDDEILNEMPADDSSSRDDDRSDEINAAFNAVHSISGNYRELLVDFYIHELSCEVLSQKYRLPSGTVKSRLFYGRKKLKERWKLKMEESRVYDRLNWYLSGNGDVYPHKYLGRQIARAIATVCYTQALTIDEISLATGIPCLYIEDELQTLLRGELLLETAGRYVTNFIIHSAALTGKIEGMLKDFCYGLAEMTTALLDDYDGALRNIGFVGCERPKSSLWWFLIPAVLREACEEARRRHGGAARTPFPLRRDGGKGWLLINVTVDERPRYISGCNGYYRENAAFTYYWSGKYFSSDINRYLLRLEDVGGLGVDADISKLDEVLCAEGVKYNVLERAGGAYRWKIAVFTQEQMKMLEALKKAAAAHLSGDLLPIVGNIYELYLGETPVRLHDQIRGVFGSQLNPIIAMVCDLLEERGLLESPKDNYFTDQILMTVI